ncbi:hypothetical protein NDU88_003873 [Pleurodeles waltl]|uniref:Uncharacterized protein n=1 Tax=Pleurodeles waltl TaxID=8319 RepID=A0AAV7MVV3_PLEWA|nr:hypothetical protein NDU88_003873 [Pleurodeles waltl]
MRVVDYTKYSEQAHSEGDKAGFLPACLIKDEPSPTPIIHILTPQFADINTQAEINTASQDYYANLYSATPALDQTQLSSFLANITLLELGNAAKLRRGSADHITGNTRRH